MEELLSATDHQAVTEILTKELDVSKAQLTSDARLMEDLGADSLTIVQIQLALEERFGICISDEQIEKIQTVGDVYELLADLLESTRSGRC